MSSGKQSRVVVLKGGYSSEREVSLVSGFEVAQALRAMGYDVIELDAGYNLASDLQAAQADIVFNALHGRWGEDGCVQGLLEWLRIPYTHSGVYASALAMDKEKSKHAYRSAALPVAESFLIKKSELALNHPMQPPYVVKPYNEGSSFGISLVKENDAPKPLSDAMPDLLLVEKFIPGRELTVTVMGVRALTVTDILTPEFYDYKAKYTAGGSKHIVPAAIPSNIFIACMDYALRAHQCLSCRGVSRSDFRWDESRGFEGLFLLETNTQPGMTPTSLAPEQAAFCDISYREFVHWIIKDASCER